MTTTVTRIGTWLNGKWVGQDSFGNDYYQQRRASRNGRRKRWVIYADTDDASFVAPNWHRWLHYGSDELPKNNDPQYVWEQPPAPNITGTAQAVYPDMRLKEKPEPQIYQPWQPPANAKKL